MRQGAKELSVAFGVPGKGLDICHFQGGLSVDKQSRRQPAAEGWGSPRPLFTIFARGTDNGA